MPRSSYRAPLSARFIALSLAHVLLSTAVLGVQSAKGQSFDCRYARYTDEKTICHEPALGRLDEELASMYRRVLLSLARPERGELDKNEDSWIRARHRCSGDRTCIEESYRKRIAELQARGTDSRRRRQDAESKPSDRQNPDRSKIDNRERRDVWLNPPRSP
jgi:uncharacterized protein